MLLKKAAIESEALHVAATPLLLSQHGVSLLALPSGLSDQFTEWNLSKPYSLAWSYMNAKIKN